MARSFDPLDRRHWRQRHLNTLQQAHETGRRLFGVASSWPRRPAPSLGREDFHSSVSRGGPPAARPDWRPSAATPTDRCYCAEAGVPSVRPVFHGGPPPRAGIGGLACSKGFALSSALLSHNPSRGTVGPR
jgi:hypothetical protein